MGHAARRGRVAGLLIDGEVRLMDYARSIAASTLDNVGGTVFVDLLEYGHVVRGGDTPGSSA